MERMTSRRWRRRINIISDFLVGFLVGRRGGAEGGLFLFGERKSHRLPATLMKPSGSIPTYVGIVRVHSAYSNQQVLILPNCVTDIDVDPTGKKYEYQGV